MKSVLAINYYFGKGDLGNKIFSDHSANMIAPYMRAFRDFMMSRNVDVVTLDTVDFLDPKVKSVLYFEYNWRMLSSQRDPFLSQIPYEKRALVLLEPAIVNPTMYYTNILRRRFSKVFTWDLRLLRKYPSYIPIRVPTGADPSEYRENRFKDIAFESKKLVAAVSRNRWHYMPQATFGKRREVYRFLQKKIPGQFDLFGLDWERACCFRERLLGRSYTSCWKGELPGGWDAKVNKLAHYKFSVCFENSTGNPGYLSEKIFDCFCARTVPIYLGSKGNEVFLPRGAYIDYRDFGSPQRLLRYIQNVSPAEHAGYVERIDEFLDSEDVKKYSISSLYQTLYDYLMRV